MGKNKCFLICGGDLRQVKLASALSDDGYKVSCYGLEGVELSGNISLMDDLPAAIEKADVIILPLPCVIDEFFINMPLSNEKLKIDQFISYLKYGQIVVGGMISDDFIARCKEHNIHLIDYFCREELVIRNTIPTVEGALQIAMEEMPITIHDSNSLVLGYGRIGKMLSSALKNLGSHVSVEARSQQDLAWINANAYHGIPLADLIQHVGSFDIIFNTVPYKLLDAKILKEVKKDVLIIDLASKPGGVDFNTASKLGVNVIWALSLPGKVAPITSAMIIKDTVLNIITELEV